MRMKTSLLLLFIVLGFITTTKGQSKEDIKIGIGLQGIELSVNSKIHNKFYLELGAGLGGGYSIDGGFSYTFSLQNITPYTKGIVKWNYVDLNRKRNFVSLQTKYSFGNSSTYNMNQALLTEFNWGIERHLSEKTIFDLHLGLGQIRDFKTKESLIIPTIGFSFKYSLFSIKKEATK